MAASFETHEDPQHEKIKRDVLDYYFKRQAEDPGFFSQIMASLQNDFDASPTVDHDVIAAAQRFVHPDDIAERARSTAAFLLTTYILTDIEAYAKIQESYIESLQQ